jgi:phosphoribosylformylglycinamidine cyclo-ligase
VLFDVRGLTPDTVLPELGESVGDALLAPHRSYLKAITPLLRAGLVKGMAHITGGGITENLPRVLPEGCEAVVDSRSWTVPPVFRVLQQGGSIPLDDMRRAFNMGIGLIIVCDAGSADRVRTLLAEQGETLTPVIGRIQAGSRQVRWVDGSGHS